MRRRRGRQWRRRDLHKNMKSGWGLDVGMAGGRVHELFGPRGRRRSRRTRRRGSVRRRRRRRKHCMGP